MSSFYTSADVHAVTADSILTARRLRALRGILDDPDDIHHDQLAALADLLVETENMPPAEFGRCCVCDYDGAQWFGAEYVHESCLADEEGT